MTNSDKETRTITNQLIARLQGIRVICETCKYEHTFSPSKCTACNLDYPPTYPCWKPKPYADRKTK